jgi:hypothetical protein
MRRFSFLLVCLTTLSELGIRAFEGLVHSEQYTKNIWKVILKFSDTAFNFLNYWTFGLRPSSSIVKKTLENANFLVPEALCCGINHSII